MEALIGKHHFKGLNQHTWLYCGAEAPVLNGAADAVQQYMEYRGKGPEGRRINGQIEQSLRENIARLIKGRPEEIALLSNASEGISAVARSMNWQKGDNVVINSLEYPSGVLPWLLLRERGVEVRVVEHTQWIVTAEDMLARVDDRTRLVVASHVSFLSGARLDYQKIHKQLRNTETLFLLDATQSLGAVPVELSSADVIVCSSYKWLLGTHGLGILAVNSEKLQLVPEAAGWRSVADKFSAERFQSMRFWDDMRRFELGFPSYPSIYALQYSTNFLLQSNTEEIERHILALGGHLISKLTELGYNVMTSADADRRAGNISVLCEDGEQLANELERQGIYFWGGSGRFRVSVHAYNDTEDIEKLVSLLPSHK